MCRAPPTSSTLGRTSKTTVPYKALPYTVLFFVHERLSGEILVVAIAFLVEQKIILGPATVRGVHAATQGGDGEGQARVPRLKVEAARSDGEADGAAFFSRRCGRRVRPPLA